MNGRETAFTRFREIAQEISSNPTLESQLDTVTGMDEVAKHFGGENWHTGGGVYVVVIQVGPHYVVGLTSECAVFYEDESSTDPEEIFYSENQTPISLLRKAWPTHKVWCWRQDDDNAECNCGADPRKEESK